MCLHPGHAGVSQRADRHGCEAVASEQEPSFTYHMIGAHVMAIMTVVVGLLRGYDWLRKSHRLSPMGGPINCDTTMFFRLHTRNLLRNWCHSNPFKGIIYSILVKMFQLYEVM